MSFTRPAVPRPLVRPAAVLCLLTVFVLGCAGQGDVTGRVTYKDKPLAFGTVLFEASDGSIRQGNIESDGTYAVRGVTTGPVRVAVNSPNPKGIVVLPPKRKNKQADTYQDVVGWFAIPKQYDSPSTSGLTYTIKGGENTIDIELK
jgi:hypothetical protein